MNIGRPQLRVSGVLKQSSGGRQQLSVKMSILIPLRQVQDVISVVHDCIPCPYQPYSLRGKCPPSQDENAVNSQLILKETQKKKKKITEKKFILRDSIFCNIVIFPA